MVFNPFYSLPFDYYDSQGPTVGENSIPRLNIGSTSSSLVSGTLYITLWTAVKTEFVTQMGLQTGAQVAAPTPTFAAYAMYQASDFSGTPNLTLLGQTANDTTMFTSTFTQYLRNFTNGGFWKYQGQRYGAAILIASGAALPNFTGFNGTFIQANQAPRLCAALTSQASIPASILGSSFSGISQMMCHYVSP